MSSSPRLQIIKQQAVPKEQPELVERVVLNRKAREVRLYLRKNTYKKCIHNLNDEQVKTLLTALQKSGKQIVDTLCFANETFIVSPQTKRMVE